MLRHGASSSMATGDAQPAFSVAVQQAAAAGDAGTLTAAEQQTSQEDDPYSRMGIFLVAGGRHQHLAQECRLGVPVPKPAAAASEPVFLKAAEQLRRFCVGTDLLSPQGLCPQLSALQCGLPGVWTRQFSCLGGLARRHAPAAAAGMTVPAVLCRALPCCAVLCCGCVLQVWLVL